MLERRNIILYRSRVHVKAVLKHLKQQLLRPSLIALAKIFLPQYQDISSVTKELNLLNKAASLSKLC